MPCELIDAKANRAGNLTKSQGPVGFLACPARFERATYALEGRCSIQLSYGQLYAGSN